MVALDADEKPLALATVVQRKLEREQRRHQLRPRQRGEIRECRLGKRQLAQQRGQRLLRILVGSLNLPVAELGQFTRKEGGVIRPRGARAGVPVSY